MKSPDMSRSARLAALSDVSAALALYGDRGLGELVDTAAPLGSGIGGRSALLEVAGTRVFVKRVPLTDLERQPENNRSTANMFALPAFCHYGIGSPGFGAWRELAVHVMTTNWMIAGSHEGFPYLYHWRVLPDAQPSLPGELADVERAVAYWGGGSQVRHRIEALWQSSASIALFLEYIPQNLHEWLGVQVSAGDEAVSRALAMAEKELVAGTAFMNARGLLHFDAHFENILTDGERLYFADYGLAVSSRFELSHDESRFFARHLTYDRCYTATHLVRWLVTALYGYQGDDRDALVRACAKGKRLTGIPQAAEAVLTRHAPLAAVMSDFYRELQQRSRDTPYPLEKICQLDRMNGSATS